MAKHTEVTKDYGAGGVALAGCFIGGVGVGLAINPQSILPGAIIGLGVGLVVMAVMARSH
ncbi:MAG: hypothetical protein JWN01_1085 [Patescibacteria group bacterium]|nr:hypothetical protein [Patescibacteria group bacterium]